MGDPLAQETFDAFGEALVKEAIPIGRVGKFIFRKAMHPVGAIGRRSQEFFGNLQEAGKRVIHPIQGLEKGYKSLSPSYEMARASERMGFKSPAEAIKTLSSRAQNAKAAMEAAKASGNQEAFRAAQRNFAEASKGLGSVQLGGQHLLDPGQTLAQAAATPGLMAKSRAVAEELSRRGWTGAGGPGLILRGRAGDITKYLPVGGKGQAALWSGMMVPSVVNAQQASPTGEGGAMEMGGRLLGSLGGMVAGGGLGFVPAVGMWSLGEYGGGRIGRILDRIRAGGTPGQAVLAPSPEQARAQLARIQKYYG